MVFMFFVPGPGGSGGPQEAPQSPPWAFLFFQSPPWAFPGPPAGAGLSEAPGTYEKMIEHMEV